MKSADFLLLFFLDEVFKVAGLSEYSEKFIFGRCFFCFQWDAAASFFQIVGSLQQARTFLGDGSKQGLLSKETNQRHAATDALRK